MKIKGFDKYLQCRGFQFEVGKTYATGAKDKDLKLCTDTVFHYCDSLQSVHQFYSVKKENGNRFCEIEVLGGEVSDGVKCGSNKIKIIREIVGDELDNLCGRNNGNLGLFNTGYYNTGYYNTGCYNTGDSNTGNHNTGNHNTGNCNTGYYNTGNRNTGCFNSCNNSTGLFCTQEPTIRIFDIDCGMTMSEARRKDWYNMLFKHTLLLTEWIGYTEEEKKQDKEKEAIGGYLKEYTYEEACQIWWSKYTDEEKAIIKSMPNFDKDKFKHITGIEV